MTITTNTKLKSKRNNHIYTITEIVWNNDYNQFDYYVEYENGACQVIWNQTEITEMFDIVS